MPSSPTTDAIIGALTALPAPAIGVELQWTLHEDDDDWPRWVLVLHGILELPGWNHSVYSTTEVSRWPAETLEQRHHAHREAQAVATSMNLWLHAPPVEDRGGQDGSAWLRSQPPGQAHVYPVQWELAWWTDDGQPREDRGVELVSALSGEAACWAHERVLRTRHAVRPLRLRTFTTGRGARETSWHELSASDHAGLHREEVCAIAFAEQAVPSRIARVIVARAPQATALQLMTAFSDTFDVDLASLIILVPWRAGEVADVVLDDALAKYIESSRPHWDGVRQLREVRSARRSVAAHVREMRLAGAGILIVNSVLREAFGLSLMEAEDFLSRCEGALDPDRAAELDRQLEQKICLST
jgi:hypothetical protein